MSRYILGIDIGSACIKLVLARESFKRFEFIQFIKGDIGEKGIEETLMSLVKQLSYTPDVIVTAMPGNQVSIHYLSFPIMDTTKIGQIVPSEVESITPFPLEKVVIDHWIIEKDKTKKESFVLVGVMKKETLARGLSTLRRVNVEPHIVEDETIALFHALMYFHGKSNNIGLLDIGNEKSNFCIIQHSRPVFIKAYSKGKSEINSLMKDLYISIHAFETRHGKSVEKIYITGAGAYVQDAVPSISEGLSRPVEIFHPGKEIIQDIPCDTKEIPLFMTSIGLAARGRYKKRAEGLNFLKGEYSRQKETQVLTKRLLYIGVSCLAVIMIGMMDFYLHYQHRVDRYRYLKKEIRQIYVETFPKAKHIVDEIQQTKSAIKATQKKLIALGGNKEGVSPIYLLKAISEKIPQDVEIRIDDFLIDKSRFRIQGVTSSFEDVEKIKKSIGSIPFLDHVTVGDARLAADQKKVKFRIIADLKEEGVK